MEPRQNSASGPEKKILTIPNILSFLRLCMIPVIVWLYFSKQNRIAAGGILLLSGATDIADGYIARRFHMTSDLGKILDPVADKLTQGVMLLCLLSHFPWMIAPVFFMLSKEIFMSVTGFLVIRKTGTVFGAEWHGKAATFLLYGMILLHLFWYDIPPIVSVSSAVACTGMITVSFYLYGSRNLRALSKHGGS